MTTLHIGQDAAQDGHYPIRLTLKRPGQPDLEAKAKIQFALTPHEQEELRWYMEDYLTRPESVEEVQVEQIEQWMKRRGEELYTKVLADNMGTQAIWFAVRVQAFLGLQPRLSHSWPSALEAIGVMHFGSKALHPEVVGKREKSANPDQLGLGAPTTSGCTVRKGPRPAM